MYDGPGSIAKVSDQRRNFGLLVEWSEWGLRKLQTGWRTFQRGGLEPDKKFEPGNASAVCVRGGVSDVLPGIKELVGEFFVKMP